MDAKEVKAYVKAKWPKAMQSPLAKAMHGASTLAILETSDADIVEMRGEAMAHAKACLQASDGWTVETLGHNIKSNFPELCDDECEKIASAAISQKVK